MTAPPANLVLVDELTRKLREAADEPLPDMDPPLAAAQGIAFGCAVATLFWLAAGVGAWLLFWH